MAMNKFMHSRNIYKTPPDFAKLSEKFLDFRAIAKTNENGKVSIDFNDETALKIFTKCLLCQDFRLTVYLPPKQLVPTLPLRLNYILWIEDIVKTFEFENVIGLDIGCGASCIYPLLATRTNPDWHMFAIELNEESVNYARDNVSKNGLNDRIEIIDCASKDEPLDALDQCKNWKHFDFTMCNPPFFKDELESDDDTAEQSKKRKPANNAKTGINCELTTTGGEVEFVRKIIQTSSQLKEKINIFTTMLGHKTSVQPILQELKSQGITNYCNGEFCQGWTKRWGVAWTFRNDLPLRIVPVIGQSQPKPPQRFLPNDIDDPDIATKKLCRILSELADTKIMKPKKIKLGECFQFIAITDSWKNQRRKRRQQARNQQYADDREGNDTNPVPEKRIKIEENPDVERVEEVIRCRYSPLLLHIEVSVQSKTLSETKAIVEILFTYLDGTSGLNGVHELLQFIQNKWSRE